MSCPIIVGLGGWAESDLTRSGSPESPSPFLSSFLLRANVAPLWNLTSTTMKFYPQVVHFESQDQHQGLKPTVSVDCLSVVYLCPFPLKNFFSEEAMLQKNRASAERRRQTLSAQSTLPIPPASPQVVSSNSTGTTSSAPINNIIFDRIQVS